MAFINADDLIIEAPDWLVEDMIPRVGVGFVYGKSYWGKSLFTNGELALAVANGVPFFGRQTVKGSVIVALGEGAQDAAVRKQARIAREDQDRMKRFSEIAREHGEEQAEEWLFAQPAYDGRKLKIERNPFTIPITRADGEGELTGSLRRFINQAKRIPDLELVVIDTLSDFTGGLSISNDTSANRMMLGLKAMVMELNCAIVVVAHPDKKGKQMLGAGRLFNAADFVIKIEPDESMAQAPGQPRTAAVICEKVKSGEMFAPLGYQIESVTWDEGVYSEGGEIVRSATIRQIEDYAPQEDIARPEKRSGMAVRPRGGQIGGQAAEIVAAVREFPEGITTAKIAAEMGIEQVTVRVALSRAVERGEIARLSPGLFGPAR